MITTLRVAALQMCSQLDRAANVARATELVEEAAAQGAKLVVLPEMFPAYGALKQIALLAETMPGETSEAMAALARRLGITLVAGSIAEKAGVGEKIFNTSLTFGPAGQLISRYRKIHLPDIAFPGTSLRESDCVQPGEEPIVAATPVGRLGHAICYDLRFPELFRRLGDDGAEILLLPSAFTHKTGSAHWHVLIRARAIENQAFVIAPNQCGEHGDTPATYGHSLIVDPWGRVLADAGDAREAVITADLDLHELAEIRRQLPCLTHRRVF